MIHQDLAVNDAVRNANEQVLAMRRVEKDLTIGVQNPTKVKAYKQRWDEQVKRTAQSIAPIGELVVDQAERDAAKQIAVELARYQAGFQDVNARIQSGDILSTVEVSAAMAPHKAAITAMQSLTAQLGERARQRAASVESRVTDEKTLALSWLAGLVGVAAVIGLAVGAFINRSITRPCALPSRRPAGWLPAT